MSLTLLIMEQCLWGREKHVAQWAGSLGKAHLVIGTGSRGPHTNLTDLPERTWTGSPGKEPGSKMVLVTQSETAVW